MFYLSLWIFLLGIESLVMLCPVSTLAYFRSFFYYTKAMLKVFFWQFKYTILINSHPHYQHSNSLTIFLCSSPGQMPATLFLNPKVIILCPMLRFLTGLYYTKFSSTFFNDKHVICHLLSVILWLLAFVRNWKLKKHKSHWLLICFSQLFNNTLSHDLVSTFIWNGYLGEWLPEYGFLPPSLCW